MPPPPARYRLPASRILSATNRDLEAEVERGTFRRDLYYRLNQISLHIPPLRDRLDEIPALARRFLAEAEERGDLYAVTGTGITDVMFLVTDAPGRASAAEARGDVEGAVGLYADADRRLTEAEVHPFAAAVRWRRGELLGGTEGRALTLSAEAWLRERTVKNPERLVRMMVQAFPTPVLLSGLATTAKRT